MELPDICADSSELVVFFRYVFELCSRHDAQLLVP